MALGPLAPIDRATLVYVAVAMAFTLARGPGTWPAIVLLPLWLMLVALVAAVLAPRARRAGPLRRMLAEFYPLALVFGLYTHVGLVNAAGGVSHDALVQRWEEVLFGGQASLQWVRAFPSPAWSTLMHAGYLAYFPIVVGSPLGLWMKGRHEATRGTLFLMMATFYACYGVFLAFPVAGPRYLFPPAVNAATAVPAAAAAHRLLQGASAWGTSFPSSHVAVALVAAFCAWRGFRPLGAVLVPAAALMSLATVYCQFHYAVDALAGGAVAAVALIAGRRAGYDSEADLTTAHTGAHGEPG